MACDGHVEGSCSQDTTWNTLYSGTAGGTGSDTARIFAPPLCPYGYATDLLRLDLDTEAASGWNNYDAIAAFGTTGLPTGLINPSTAASPNRVLYTPTAGIHGLDSLDFKMTDCSDLSATAAGISVTVVPPTGEFFEAFSYTVTADSSYVNIGDATAVSIDLSNVYAALGDVTAVIEVWASEFDSVSLSSSGSAFSTTGDAITVDLSSYTSLDLSVVSSSEAAAVTIGSENTVMSRLELWVYDSADTAGSPTTYRVMLEHCPFGFMALLSSGSDQSTCMSCAAISAATEAQTLSLSDADSDNFDVICTSSARAAYQCPPGEFFDSSSLDCSSCSPGSYASGTAVRSSCSLCAPGTAAPGSTMAKCLDCTWGTVATGYGAEVCDSCPSHATCPNGDEVVVSQGGWRTGTDSWEIYECPFPAACTGGNGTDLCSEGHKGPKCAVCKPEYFFSEFEGGCKFCETKESGLVISALLVLGAAAFAFLVGLVVVVKTMSKSTNVTKLRKNAKAVAQVWDVAKFKVAWAAFQITTSVNWTLDISFPEPFATFEGLISSITQLSLSQLMPIECLAPYSHHTHLLFVTLMPLAFIIFVLAVGSMLKSGSLPRQVCNHAAIMVAFIVLPTTSTAILRTFHCQDFDSGYGRFLVADLSIDCDGTGHQGMTGFAVCMLLIYPIGMPLLFLFLLSQSREDINPSGFDFEFSAIAQRNSDPKLTTLKPLFEPYKPSLWFFEAIDLWRRIVMMGTLTFIPGKPTRAAVGLFLSILFSALYRELEPYAAQSVNTLSTAAHWQVVLVFLSGLIIVGKPFGYDDSVMGLMLLFVSFFFIATAVVLQSIHGTAKLELEQRVLEHEAREVDLALSHAELLACVDSVASPIDVGKSARRISVGAPEETIVEYLQSDKAKKPRKPWCGKKPKSFFDDGAYPCYVVPHSTLVKYERLPVHEHALKDGMLLELRMETRVPSSSHTFFVSQNWEGALGTGPNGAGQHPDNAMNTKLRWLKNLKQHMRIPDSMEVWIWWDGISVPQIDKQAQRRAVASLCFYCQLCTRFVGAYTDGTRKREEEEEKPSCHY